MVYEIRRCIWGNQHGSRDGDVFIEGLVGPHDPTSLQSCGVSTDQETVAATPSGVPMWETAASDPALLVVLWPSLAAVVGARCIMRTIRGATP